MTRKHAACCAFLLISVVIAAGALIYKRYRDEELDVYVALLQSVQLSSEMKDVAFMSAVSSCRVDSASLPQEQDLIAALQVANRPEAGPRALERLSGLANVVAWGDTQRIHDSGGVDSLERASARRIIRISRVGFNEAHDKAVLCFEPGGEGALVFFVKDSPFHWRQVSQFSVWVS